MQHYEIDYQHNKLYRLVYDTSGAIFDAFVKLYEIKPVVKLYEYDAKCMN